MKLPGSGEMQKKIWLINGVIIVIVIAFAICILSGVFNDINDSYRQIAVALIILWVGILVSYYVWAIYFYNVNLGYSDEEWESIRQRRSSALMLKDSGLEYDPSDLDEPSENPYQDETFGLPVGTVRGTIALTLLMGGLAMLIYSIGHPEIPITDHLEFFIQAFLMMVAFYFGSKVLEYWQRNNGTAATDTSETPAKSSVQPVSATSQDIASIALVSHKSQIRQTQANRELTREIIADTARSANIEPAALQAVIKIESSGQGFLPDGRPKILFEGHIFWRQLEKAKIDPQKYSNNHPGIVYKYWTKEHYLGGAAEFERLNTARLMNEDAALASASWGLFQIMGFNYRAAGFRNLHDFIEAHFKDESEHLQAFMKFIQSQNMVEDLQALDWTAFARKYNGPAFAKNQYDKKLATAYKYYREQGWNETGAQIS